MTTTSPDPSTPAPAPACDGCQSRDTWLLHHVSHRGNLSDLCTSCVLKYNPGSFCLICLDLFPKSQPHRPLVHCSRCPMISHLSCLPNPNLASQFVCPSCKDLKGFSFFPEGKGRMVDNKLGKVFFAAARLAMNSLRLVAVKASEEADAKVRVAVNARKRARELLKNAVILCTKEREGKEKETCGALASVPKVEETKRKVVRVQNREFEKWVRFHEPIPKVMGAVTNGFGLEEKKGKVLGSQSPRLSQPSQAHAGVKSRVSVGFGLEEKEKNVNLLVSPNEGRSLVGGDKKGLRAPQGTQDKGHVDMRNNVASGVKREDKEKKVKLLGSPNAGGLKEEERRLVEDGEKSSRLLQATQGKPGEKSSRLLQATQGNMKESKSEQQPQPKNNQN